MLEFNKENNEALLIGHGYKPKRYPLHLITKTTANYSVKIHYYTPEGLGYFFGFLAGADFNIPMVWFKDGTIFWDECYGDQHLDLTNYNKAMEESYEPK